MASNRFRPRPWSTGLRVQPLAGDELVEEHGRLVIPAAGSEIDDDVVRALRAAGQR
jgi:hypothetical protein